MTLAPDILALVGELDFDPDALHAKYIEERDKRLNSAGIGQYVEVAGDFSHYVDDPYVEPDFTRDPVFDEVDFAVIGGGFGGLLMAARLREAGVDSLRVVETGGDFGGTWYWNRYPGAMCDIESYIYLPLLDELGYVPKHRYSFAPEIFEHSRNIAKHYNLYENALLQTSITGLRWVEDEARWLVSTDRGDRFKARFVAMANGALSRPKLPGIEGIDRFKGHTFHTSRWDYAYTGGTSHGDLVRLRDKRVGIIGTGATGIQCIPHLGESSEHLYVFQRTPSSIDVRNNRPTDPEWAKTLEPGWQQKRMDNFNILVSGGEQDVDLVQDGWTDIYRSLTGTAAEKIANKLGRPLTSSERAELLTLLDYRKMNQIRARTADIVKNADAATALMPWYRQFCKRPGYHDEYLQTFNRPNVTLVDTMGHGVERLTERGAVVDGKEIELDCLIFATGFEVGTSFTRRAGYDIVGRGGVTLSDHWDEGMRTFHGYSSHGFPNCFFLGFTQTAITVNLPHALNEQALHVVHVVKECLARDAGSVEPTAEAEAGWVAEINRLARLDTRFSRECTPGYYNSEGEAGNKRGFNSDLYAPGPVKFFELLSDWRENGSFQGLAFGREVD